jgi:hypothetical protein
MKLYQRMIAVGAVIATLTSGCNVKTDEHSDKPRPDYDNKTAITRISDVSAFGDIAAGDVDGDGLADILYTDSFGNVYAHKNLGDNKFARLDNPVLRIGNGYRIAAADMDGDGLVDILSENRDTGDIYVHKNLGNLNFEQ